MGVGEWRDGGGWVPEESWKKPGCWGQGEGTWGGRDKAPSRGYLPIEIFQQFELSLLKNFHTYRKLQD